MTRHRVATTTLTATATVVASLTAALFSTSAAHADLPPGYVHAVVTCQSATLYTGFNPGLHGTTDGDPGIELDVNKKVAIQTEAPVYNGWLDTLDMGPNTTGWLRTECVGGYGSW